MTNNSNTKESNNYWSRSHRSLYNHLFLWLLGPWAPGDRNILLILGAEKGNVRGADRFRVCWGATFWLKVHTLLMFYRTEGAKLPLWVSLYKNFVSLAVSWGCINGEMRKIQAELGEGKTCSIYCTKNKFKRLLILFKFYVHLDCHVSYFIYNISTLFLPPTPLRPPFLSSPWPLL